MNGYFRFKKWHIVLLLSAATMLLLSGIAYAVVSVDKSVPASVTVNLAANPQGALSFYSDSACTQPVTKLDFGELKPGVTGLVSVYIKNLTSETKFRYFSVTDDLDYSSVAISPNEVWFYDMTWRGLLPGASYHFDIFLYLQSGITIGPHDFVIVVNAQSYEQMY